MTIGEEMAARIRTRLEEEFKPSQLEIADESDQHRGHGGYKDGGGTHFRVTMRSAAFNGVGRVARQRAVYRTLTAELEERVHALALHLHPEED